MPPKTSSFFCSCWRSSTRLSEKVHKRLLLSTVRLIIFRRMMKWRMAAQEASRFVVCRFLSFKTAGLSVGSVFIMPQPNIDKNMPPSSSRLGLDSWHHRDERWEQHAPRFYVLWRSSSLLDNRPTVSTIFLIAVTCTGTCSTWYFEDKSQNITH